jgi:predicted phage terminase large subunit-like protein
VPVVVERGQEAIVIAEAVIRARARQTARARLQALPWKTTPASFAEHLSGGRWVIAPHLQMLSDWLVDAVAGKRARIIVEMPPRHGKSELVSRWFPVWFLERHPDKRVILASYEADFAGSWGRRVRNAVEEHQAELYVQMAGDSSAAHRWETTDGGGMMTAGVGGPITGKGAHALIVDDPVKNAEQAASPVYREKAWEWWQSTAYTRIEPGGCAILVMTRWNEDDLAGRIIEHSQSGSEPWDVLRLPALAEEDDPLGRAPDAPLWPQRYDADALANIRQTVGSYWWAALYQQRPSPREGGLFKRAWFTLVDAVPVSAQRIRYWDKAATAGDGDYTAGVLMARTPNGLYYIEDVTRGQWSAGERDAIILQTAQMDASRYGLPVVVWSEQEPGSGGKESAQNFRRMLAGYPVYAEPVTGDKAVRAEPLAAQCEAGNVRMLRGAWNSAYLDEMCAFPNGAHDDQVDGSSGAFNKLAGAKRMIATSRPGYGA